MPCSVSGRHTLICLQLLSTFVNKIFLKCMKHFHLPLITNTLAPQSHTPPPPPPPNSIPVDLDLSRRQILRSRATPHPRTPAVPPPTTFDAYIQCLGQWEYYLLRNSTINTDMFRLSETIQNNPQIIAASDGSVSSSVRDYGWICSLPHRQQLATNHGPILGSLPSSFLAEAYGLLSYLQFLYHVSQYTHSPLPKETILYTDSASLIAKIGKIEKWPYFFPNATMYCPYITLSLPTQLNVDANHLAGSYAPRPNENPTIVTMIAGTAVSLHLSSGTTTTKYRSALRKAASMDTIQHYIQNKNKWTDAEFDSINWVAHKKQFIIKFIHDELPLGRLTSKYKKHHLSTCPTCSHDIEDGDHFLQCTEHPQWKSDKFCALHNSFDKTPTRPFLGNLLITSLSKWLHNEPAIFFNFPPYTAASFSTRHESAGSNC